jgi:hypothetical protein
MCVVKSWTIAFLVWAVLGLQVLAQHGHGSHVQVNRHGSKGTDRALNAPPDVLAKARALVKDAIAQAAVRNKARLEHPSRNQYKLKPGTKVLNRRGQPPDTQPVPALFNVTEEIADAAALLAEYEAAAELNATGTVKRDYSHIDVLHKRQRKEKRAGTWWMGNKEHRGSWPWGNDNSYEVFRDVTDSKWATDGAAKCEPNGLVVCEAPLASRALLIACLGLHKSNQQCHESWQ